MSTEGKLFLTQVPYVECNWKDMFNLKNEDLQSEVSLLNINQKNNEMLIHPKRKM